MSVAPDKAAEAMSTYGGTVLKTSLSKEGEKELQDALHSGGATICAARSKRSAVLTTCPCGSSPGVTIGRSATVTVSPRMSRCRDGLLAGHVHAQFGFGVVDQLSADVTRLGRAPDQGEHPRARRPRP